MKAYLPCIWLLILTLGCSSTRQKASTPPPAPPAPYTRIQQSSPDQTDLQVAVRHFKGPRKKDPLIYLVGVSHIGDSNYYQSLQKLLDSHQVVLFEGVNNPQDRTEEMVPERVSPSLQSNLAKSLGLVFQLEAINYKRAHFKNSDLTIEEIELLLEGDDKPIADRANTSLDDVMSIMDGTSIMGVIADAALKIVGSSPRLQSFTRLMLIEMLGSLEGDLSSSPALPPNLRELFEVLIKSRNQKVVKDLRMEIKRKPKTISIFYGAGHMDDLERRLTHELKYLPVETTWFTAFEVNTRKAGITNWERNLIRSVVRMQMQVLQPEK